MSPMSAESTVVRNYLDWLLSIPWGKAKPKKIDVAEGRAASSTRTTTAWRRSRNGSWSTWPCSARTNSLKGPILCLVGPPGVGKTSLGRSIAKATHREFVRLSLGGVRDEAEIRGHRRTYIGSMPGKVIQSMKKGQGDRSPSSCWTRSTSWAPIGGADPSSALLEVLDPEQNSTFGDHYLEIDYDLSQVMFVTTFKQPEHAPAADGPHGDHPHPRLHRG